MKIQLVTSRAFRQYGRVIKGYPLRQLANAMENTECPADSTVYYPSVPELEKLKIFKFFSEEAYGGMPIQIGYCNGRNTTYNGFEYHKGSELNIAATDCMLVLGHTWQIEQNTFTVGNETVFFVPRGTVIELFQTTLHLSPCRVCDSGFKVAVVLPRGTNTPLQTEPANRSGEARLLLQTNKWVLSHPDREPLMKQGAFPGLLGENKELKY
jgi:hypothetical protein